MWSLDIEMLSWSIQIFKITKFIFFYTIPNFCICENFIDEHCLPQQSKHLEILIAKTDGLENAHYIRDASMSFSYSVLDGVAVWPIFTDNVCVLGFKVIFFLKLAVLDGICCQNSILIPVSYWNCSRIYSFLKDYK